MNVLIKPIISEKMQAVSEKFNRYGFIVDRKATKTQIKKAVEDTYGVNAEIVNTLIQGNTATLRNTQAGVLREQKDTVQQAITIVLS